MIFLKKLSRHSILDAEQPCGRLQQLKIYQLVIKHKCVGPPRATPERLGPKKN